VKSDALHYDRVIMRNPGDWIDSISPTSSGAAKPRLFIITETLADGAERQRDNGIALCRDEGDPDETLSIANCACGYIVDRGRRIGAIDDHRLYS
jgi:hypothetical protein